MPKATTDQSNDTCPVQHDAGRFGHRNGRHDNQIARQVGSAGRSASSIAKKWTRRTSQNGFAAASLLSESCLRRQAGAAELAGRDILNDGCAPTGAQL